MSTLLTFSAASSPNRSPVKARTRSSTCSDRRSPPAARPRPRSGTSARCAPDGAAAHRPPGSGRSARPAPPRRGPTTARGGCAVPTLAATRTPRARPTTSPRPSARQPRAATHPTWARCAAQDRAVPLPRRRLQVPQAGRPGFRERGHAQLRRRRVDVLPAVHLGQHLVQPPLGVDLPSEGLLALATGRVAPPGQPAAVPQVPPYAGHVTRPASRPRLAPGPGRTAGVCRGASPGAPPPCAATGTASQPGPEEGRQVVDRPQPLTRRRWHVLAQQPRYCSHRFNPVLRFVFPVGVRPSLGPPVVVLPRPDLPRGQGLLGGAREPVPR